MKFDSESPYHHTRPSQEHATKVMVHSESPFIFAKDNHFMIDMMDTDKEQKDGLIHTSPVEKKKDCLIHTSPVEKKKDGLIHTSPVEKTSFRVTSPAKQILNLEDSLNRNRNDDEFMENPFSAPSTGFKMVVKEDFYSDKIVTDVKDPKMNDCTDDDHCHLVKDISVDKEIQCSDRNVVDSEETGRIGSSIFSQSLDNVHNDLTSETVGSVGADDLKCTVFDSVAAATIDEDQATPANVLNDDLDGNGSCLFSLENRVLDRSSSMLADTTKKVFDLPADHVSVSGNDSDRKGSFMSSIESDSKENAFELPTDHVSVSDDDSDGHGSLSSISDSKDRDVESALNNIPSEVTESTGFPASDVCNDCDGKGSASSINHGGKVDTFGSVVSNISADVNENQSSPSHEITTDSSTVDTSSLNFMNESSYEQKYMDISEESNSVSTCLSFRSEVPAGNVPKEISADCKLPGGVITFNFDREVASTSGGEENKITNSMQSEVIKNGAGTEEAMIEVPTTTKCSFLHLMQGESNLTGPDILSGPIANSGHIPYSGSISLRSDSSTTSARSFAFPILQSEWNSSPVKMAKADRRHLRKHRGWRMGILCCRF